MAREHALIFGGLVREDFGGGEGGGFAVGDAPEAVGGDFGGHVVVFGVDDEVDVVVAEFFEGVVDLWV